LRLIRLSMISTSSSLRYQACRYSSSNVGVVIVVAGARKKHDRCDLTKPVAELDLELEAFAEDHLGVPSRS